MYSNKNHALIMCYPDLPDKDDPDHLARMNWLKKYMPVANIHQYTNASIPMVDAWDDAFKIYVNDNPADMDILLVLHDDVVSIDVSTVDDDQHSDLIFDYQDDVVCVRYKVHDLLIHYTWSNLSTFHNGFFLIRNPKEIFKMVPAPWWDWLRHPETHEMVNCNCQAFQRKCEGYGYTFRNTGLCIHHGSKRWNEKTTTGPTNTDTKRWQKRQNLIKKRRLDRINELNNQKKGRQQ